VSYDETAMLRDAYAGACAERDQLRRSCQELFDFRNAIKVDLGRLARDMRAAGTDTYPADLIERVAELMERAYG
jgi:hypothetical protein